LKEELFKKELLGHVIAYVYVIEFQKRGFLHAHFLIILKQSCKLQSREEYDHIVCAEVPNKEENSYLHAAIVKHMIHGPCGELNKNNVCMNTKSHCCKNKYPKQFFLFTTYGQNSYPKYKCRDNGAHAKVRGATLDNRWVVPYNPYLLATFDCHMNVEICSTISAVKVI